MRSRIVTTHTLSTLGAGAAIIAGTRIDATRLNGCKPREIHYGVSIRGKTTDQGPLLYGLSVGLSAGEIGEWFSADPQSRKDADELEQSQRKVLVLGHIHKEVTSGADGNAVPDGLQSVDWPGWEVIEGETLNTFVLNADGSALSTGTIVDLFTEILGEWLND